MEIIQDRRALHRIPELDLTLPKTTAYLIENLTALNCTVLTPAEGAVCAFFDFGQSSTIAFRADTDALAVQETTGAPYASTHPGRMHACGHDGHMAILLELARRLNRKETLNTNVLLVFQPGEESVGGAKLICESGVFEQYRVEAIFGLHLWPGLTAGRVFSREKELMSRSCELDVDIFGKSAHIGRSWEGIDAMEAGLEFYRRVTGMEKAMAPEIFRLLKFGHMTSGQVRNAISDHTRLEGSLRAFQDEVFEGMLQSILDTGREIEREFGCTVKVSTSSGYPAILNPADLYHKTKALTGFEELPEPSLTSEDFSFYQRRIPGMFFFLGLGDVPSLHNSGFDFDETLLLHGADFFEQIAEGWR